MSRITSSSISPRLRRFVEAARHAKQNPDGADIREISRALQKFGTLARWVVPVYGVFVPSHNEIAVAIEHIANQHLALGRAREEFRNALSVVEPFERRDAIETAQNLVRSASDEAYFYAGVAIGVTFADLIE